MRTGVPAGGRPRPPPARELAVSFHFTSGATLDSFFIVDWPTDPVESDRRFVPPFCPRRHCPEHRRTRPGYRFVRYGTYSTLQQARIPRFRCATCRRTFSRQTFATSYYLKRRRLLLPIAAGLVAGSANRQIARSLSCAPTTVARQTARLGRHAILLLTRALDHLAGKVAEPFVLDHFETFEFTQDYPFGVATPVGADSWFVYALDPVPHARTGKRTPALRRRIATRPQRPNHGGYVGSTRRILDLLVRCVEDGRTLRIRGDGHPAYDAATRRHPDRERFELGRFPNPRRGPKGSPRSPEAIARDTAMFPVDLLHKLLRHTGAHYRRETIAFARRINAAMERLFLTAIWRNFVKRRSERKPRPQTPASWLGLADAPWTWGRVMARRLFPVRQPVPPLWDLLYRRQWETPVLPRNATHDAALAF